MLDCGVHCWTKRQRSELEEDGAATEGMSNRIKGLEDSEIL